MKVKNINTVLLIALLLTSCTPAVTVSSPTETALPSPMFSPVPATAALTPTVISENPSATSAPVIPLDAEGPWLLYVHNFPRLGMYDVPDVEPEFILINQDGSGRTPITLFGCYGGSLDNYLRDRSNATTYMAPYDPGMYLFQPSEAMGILLFERRAYPTCQTFWNGDEKSGLLASIYPAGENTVPELIIYELPSAETRDRFPLVQCTQDRNTCEEAYSIWEDLGNLKPKWSPNGRYLAFAALLNAASSDLFVYDSQDGSVRRLTHGPDWVGPIEWSPDGTQIIMQEILNEDMHTYGPFTAVPSSVWAVSVSTNEIRLLLTGNAYMHHNILRWLDDSRFIDYEGSLLDPMYGALNLRVVDMDTGTSRMLFDDWFVMHSFDPIHETLAIIKQSTEKSPEGIYLASIKTDTVRRLEQPPYVSWDFQWDSGTGLFVTTDDCQNDPQSLQAFDYQGSFSCIPKPTPTLDPMEIASYPAPNGTSSLSVKGGLWLETESKLAIQVSPETASDIIWCPDSSCFFFSVLKQNQQWTLYHVSLPDLIIKMADEGIQSKGSYEWLGGEK